MDAVGKKNFEIVDVDVIILRFLPGWQEQRFADILPERVTI